VISFHLSPRVRVSHKAVTELIRKSISEWNDDDAPRLSAAVAFYTLLSLSPMLIIAVDMAGAIFGRAAAAGQLAWEIHDVVGWDEARMVQETINAAQGRHAGLLAAVLSTLLLLFGASSVVVELRSGLNTIWHVAPPGSSSGWKAMIEIGKQRFFSFVLILFAGCLLLISVAVSTGIATLGRLFGPALPVPEAWLHVAAFLISYFVFTALFALIYRVMPDVKLEWRDVAVGASVTSLIFAAGKQAIALYLGKAAFSSAYGAAGSFVILLVWVYYSAQLFFFGAEFTKVYAATYGSRVAAEPIQGLAHPQQR
jgi:membrane protein